MESQCFMCTARTSHECVRCSRPVCRHHRTKKSTGFFSKIHECLQCVPLAPRAEPPQDRPRKVPPVRPRQYDNEAPVRQHSYPLVEPTVGPSYGSSSYGSAHSSYAPPVEAMRVDDVPEGIKIRPQPSPRTAVAQLSEMFGVPQEVAFDAYQRHGGRMDDVVPYLEGLSAGPHSGHPAQKSVDPEDVARLVNVTGCNEQMATEALKRCRGNIKQAADMLLEDMPFAELSIRDPSEIVLEGALGYLKAKHRHCSDGTIEGVLQSVDNDLDVADRLLLSAYPAAGTDPCPAQTSQPEAMFAAVDSSSYQHDVLLYMTNITGDRQVRDHCRQMAAFLYLNRIPYTEVDVSENRFLRKKLIQLCGGVDKNLPLLFVGDTHVGNYEEVFDINEQGKLESALQAAGYIKSAAPVQCSAATVDVE